MARASTAPRDKIALISLFVLYAGIVIDASVIAHRA